MLLMPPADEGRCGGPWVPNPTAPTQGSSPRNVGACPAKDRSVTSAFHLGLRAPHHPAPSILPKGLSPPGFSEGRGPRGARVMRRSWGCAIAAGSRRAEVPSPEPLPAAAARA